MQLINCLFTYFLPHVTTSETPTGALRSDNRLHLRGSHPRRPGAPLDVDKLIPPSSNQPVDDLLQRYFDTQLQRECPAKPLDGFG